MIRKLATIVQARLKSQLDALVMQDQSERKRYQVFVKKMNNDWSKAAREWARKTSRPIDDLFNDQPRIRKLKSILKSADLNKVTRSEWEKIWLLAQHADFDVVFQRYVLDLLEKYLGTDSDSYKYLYDRIKCNLTGSQRYNTQDICEKES